MATPLPTTIGENTTLTVGGSPYTGTSVTVPAGVALSVEPGVVIQLNSTLNVSGTLSAAGTEAAPILFTSSTNTGARQWSGIKFKAGSSQSSVVRTEIRYASTGVTVSEGAAPTIANSFIHANKEGAVWISGASPEVRGNTISGNGSTAINFSAPQGSPGSIKVDENLIEGNKGAGISVSAPTASTQIESASMGGNTIKGNAGKAIDYDAYATTSTQYHSNPVPPNIATNTIIGNSQNGIWLRGKVAQSTTWEDNGYPFVIESEAPIIDGATLTLGPGLVIKGPLRVGGIQDGVLNAEGTVEDPVIFTSPKDDSVGGDSNGNGAATVPAPGDWSDLLFEAKGGGILDHVIVRYGGRSSYSGEYAAVAAKCRVRSR
jgi:hypothetical protein